MFRFFRKIRHKLLIEKRLSSYFIYAVGEIFLIVIGILIAIQVNNWNNNIQDAKTLAGYLNTIDQNIEVDQINLQLISNFRDSSIIGSTYFMKMIGKEEVLAKDLKLYFSQYFKYNPWLDESFQTDQSGFEALKNSVYLSKIQQTPIESKLYKYYSLVEKIRKEEESLNLFMEEMEYDMYKSNVVHVIKSNLSKLFRNQFSEKELYELKSSVNYPAFVGSHSRNMGVGYLTDLYAELANAAKELREAIEE